MPPIFREKAISKGREVFYSDLLSRILSVVSLTKYLLCFSFVIKIKDVHKFLGFFSFFVSFSFVCGCNSENKHVFPLLLLAVILATVNFSLFFVKVVCQKCFGHV